MRNSGMTLLAVFVFLAGAVETRASEWTTIASETPELRSVAQRLNGSAYACSMKFKCHGGQVGIRIVPFKKNGKLEARIDTRGGDISMFDVEQIRLVGDRVYLELRFEHDLMAVLLDTRVSHDARGATIGGIAMESFETLLPPHETVSFYCRATTAR